MAAIPYPPPPTASLSDNDIFSISDAHLAQRYQFIREIGAGNWGCVWLCSPRSGDSDAHSTGSDVQQRVAVKLVFREKKPTTAQRVRSLWNEMKIVRALKHDSHPSIVSFHSFIITPSFAIITMEYLPHLIPVEIPESKAKEWFRCLLSAVLFLHSRGIVHNDVKPANILLSKKKDPVLVDFGFAERYDPNSKRAFLSNLAYGTPEYLSPERARGNVHDTRKSDIWSLGITFFEIIVGRSPFEYTEGEKFTTPEDLERYWARTVKGKWVGAWSMSKNLERMLRRMISPNADIRCTAVDAMSDHYWTDGQIRSDADVSGTSIINCASPVVKASRPKRAETKLDTAQGKENIVPLKGKDSRVEIKQPKVVGNPARRAHVNTLPVIEGSPRSPSITKAKDNSPPVHQANIYRRHVRKPVPKIDQNLLSPMASPQALRVRQSKERNRKGRGVLLDMTRQVQNVASDKGKLPGPGKPVARLMEKGSSSQDRVKAFDRLKQLEKSELEEENELDEAEESEEHAELLLKSKPSFRLPTPVASISSSKVTESAPKEITNKPRTTTSSNSLLTNILNSAKYQNEGSAVTDNANTGSETFPRSRNGSSLSLLKQGIRVSIDKTMSMYKSSSLGRTSKRSGFKISKLSSDGEDPHLSITRRESWEGESLIRHAKSSLPVVRHAIHAEQVAADNNVDRMSMWIRNVEQVVREAQENFASSSVKPLPPLPARPVIKPVSARNGRHSRMPRKILAADQIFQATDPTSTSFTPSEYTSPDTSNISTVITIPSEGPSGLEHASPRPRRATISSLSPGSKTATSGSCPNIDSPSKRTEKARSSGDLNALVRPISPLSQLQQQLENEETRVAPSLSTLLDRTIFIAKSGSTPPLHEYPSIPTIPNASMSPKTNDHDRTIEDSTVLDASKNADESIQSFSSPGRRHVEGVYDRFLMATTGVKRVGRGYQSDNRGPVQNMQKANTYKKSSKLFGNGRRPMPPPVSSADFPYSTAVDDFGKLTAPYTFATAPHKEENGNTVRVVAKAFKAMVTGKSVQRSSSQSKTS